MMLRSFVSGVILIWSAWVSARLEYENSLSSVYNKGSHEQGGFFYVTSTSDDFPDASPETPVFMEIVLEKNALLAHTLVDQSNGHSDFNQPIYLPLRLDTADQTTEYSLAAPANTLSIVRWVAGEGSVWLRIQSSSTTWLETNDAALPPTVNHRVTWALGLSAAQYAADSAGAPSNLPFPSKDPNTEPNAVENAVSTLFCLDLSQSSLETTGPNSLLAFYTGFYDQRVQTQPGVFATNPNYEIEVEEVGLVWNLARAGERGTSLVVASQRPALNACSEGALGESVNEMILDFQQAQALVPGALHYGSYVELTVGSDASYGFEASGVTFMGQNTPGVTEVQPSSEFTLNGRTLYRVVRLVWDGDSKDFGSGELRVSAKVVHACDTTELRLAYGIHLMNGAKAQDTAPFEGPIQNVACEPQSFLVDLGVWLHSQAIGSGVMTHVTRPGHGFETNIILANTGQSPESWQLNPWNTQGRSLSPVFGVLEPGQTRTWVATELFQDEDVSHFELASNPALKVTGVYRSVRENAGPAHVGPTEQSAIGWRLYPGNPVLTWDGVAVVNAGALSSEVLVYQMDSAGQILDQEFLALDLAPNEKRLMVLSERFQEVPGAYYELVSTQPTLLLSLRGDHGGLYLWQNHAVPIK